MQLFGRHRPGSVIPAQAGLQRSRSAGPPPDPSFRRRPGIRRQDPGHSGESCLRRWHSRRQILSRRRPVAPARVARCRSTNAAPQPIRGLIPPSPEDGSVAGPIGTSDDPRGPLPHRLRTSVPTQATIPTGAGRNPAAAQWQAPAWSVIPAQAGIQRIPGRHCALVSPFRRRPESSAAARHPRIRHSGAGRNPVRSLSEHGRPGNSTRPRPRLARISCAPTSRARRTAYPHPSTTPAGHKETGVSLQ